MRPGCGRRRAGAVGRRLRRRRQFRGMYRLQPVDGIEGFPVHVPGKLPQQDPVSQEVDQGKTVILDGRHVAVQVLGIEAGTVNCTPQAETVTLTILSPC